MTQPTKNLLRLIDEQMSRQPILLSLDVTCLPEREERERSWLEGYRHACSVVTEILIGLPSFAEVPDALRHNLVLETLDQCRASGLKVILGRDLWERWPGRSNRHQKENDVYDHGYFAAYLAGLDAEAEAIGADGTWAQCEPYGDSRYKPWFKETGFIDKERNRVWQAIGRARLIAPPTTYAYPSGSANPQHYSWALRYLGSEFLCGKTRYARNVSEVHMNPPFPPVPPQLDWWGSAVKPIADATSDQLTLPEFLGLDADAIKDEYPEFLGFWVYVDPANLLDVMTQMGQAA